MSDTGVEYMVSVRLMVYNHGDFLRHTLDSIFAQETDFFIEVVLGDDFSTDDSATIAKNYKSTEKIHLKVLDRPVGGTYQKVRQTKGRLYNFTNIVDNCTGKYVALLDGDDYWTDTRKLQKQVDFLEQNQDFSICFHNAQVIYEREGEEDKMRIFKKAYDKTEYSIEDIFGKLIMHSSTIMFRQPENFVFPDWFYQLPVGDLPLVTLMAHYGKLKCIDEPMSVYRKNMGGITTKRDGWDFFIGKVVTIYHLNQYYNFQYKESAAREYRFVRSRFIYDLFKSGRIFSDLKDIVKRGLKK